MKFELRLQQQQKPALGLKRRKELKTQVNIEDSKKDKPELKRLKRKLLEREILTIEVDLR